MSERQAGTFRRSVATDAEWKMGVLLDAARIPFRWQEPIVRFDEYTSAGNVKTYWADFGLWSAKHEGIDILVEIDGPIHDRHADDDAKRDEYLRRRGYRVLRFTNRDVLHRGRDVIATIQTELARR